MRTLRSLAIAVAAAGALAGLPARSAQACDNDRYPCPVVAQPQEADAAVRPPQSRKKASRAARQDEKAPAKAERQSAQAPSQANPATPEQAADAGSRKGRGGRNESPVSAAAAAWPVLPNAAGAGEQDAAADDGAPTVPARGVCILPPSQRWMQTLRAGGHGLTLAQMGNCSRNPASQRRRFDGGRAGV